MAQTVSQNSNGKMKNLPVVLYRNESVPYSVRIYIFGMGVSETSEGKDENK
jgi:hypothetical protein